MNAEAAERSEEEREGGRKKDRAGVNGEDESTDL